MNRYTTLALLIGVCENIRVAANRSDNVELISLANQLDELLGELSLALSNDSTQKDD